MTSSSTARVTRLRMLAGVVVVFAAMLAFVVGSQFPARESPVPGTIENLTSYTTVSDTGEGAFNWLFALAVFGPGLVMATVLYVGAEISAAVRRAGRTRSRDKVNLEVGDEI